jgi:hypothetical protein
MTKLFTIPSILLLLTVLTNIKQKPTLAIEPCMGPDNGYNLILPEKEVPEPASFPLEFAVYTNSSYSYKQTLVFINESGKQIGEAGLHQILPDNRVTTTNAQAILATEPYTIQAKGTITVNVNYQVSKTGNCSEVKSVFAGKINFQ